MRLKFVCAIFGLLGLSWMTGNTLADVTLPVVIDRSMVLQRDCPLPIWGKASPGETVRVRFRDQDKTAQADDQGRWQVKLDALKAGGPDTLRITGTNGMDLVLDDVLVGEVWVGSGQSNMAGGSQYYRKHDRELVRLIQAAPYPRLRLLTAGRKWQVATTNTIDAFSALMFAFGIRLHQALDVPVGLLVGAVGGTPSGFWIAEKDYRADAACKEVVAKFAGTYDLAAARKNHAALTARWDKVEADAKAAGKKPPRLPHVPQPAGEPTHGKIGNLYEARILPFIPFAIRGVLWDQGESSTAITGVDQYTLMGALIGSWRQAWGQGDFPFIYVQKPSGGGCAWDPADIINKQADAFSPLPEAVPKNAEGLVPALHIHIMNYPNTYMVTASDLGGSTHPVNKSGYGARAARVALGAVYGKPLEIYGPVFQKQTIEGDKVRLEFTHTGQGLAFKHGAKLQGFAVAGADRVFHWADASIDGNTVVVSAAQVPKPAAVRYAWASTHPWANLFNRDGLPALTFRTDDW